MSNLGFALLFTFIGSFGALLGGMILLSQEKVMKKISHLLASFAAGVLLGSAFFDLLPEAIHEGEEKGMEVLVWTLVGIVAFFLFERSIHWFHHHEEYHDENERKSTVPLIVAGDTVHNFLDGVVIAATFMISIPTGIVTSLAVFAHEFPQEIGDFGLLLHKKVPRRKIIFINLLSAAASFAGVILTIFMGEILKVYMPVLLALTAGFFIYIAASDLIPEIHHEKRRGFAFYESGLLVTGILVTYILVSALSGLGGH